MKQIISALIATALSVGTAASQTVPADSASIYFHQSKVALMPGFHGNGESLDRLAGELTDSTLRLARRVRVVGSASPEGSVEFNRYLSEQRADRIFSYFASRDLIDADSAQFTFTGRNWAGLRQMVIDDPDVPCRDEVIALIDRQLSGTVTDENATLSSLKHLDGGRAYYYMYTRLFPTLRMSAIYVDFAQPARRATCHIHSDSPWPLPVTTPAPPAVTSPYFPASKPFYMALKSNMLYDVLALPSIGTEFYLGRNFSIVGNWTYGWWKSDKVHRYWRAYGGDIAVRYWFGKAAWLKPLTGHHIGVFGGVVTYDFEFGGQGWMGGRPGHTLWDRCNRMAGIEYGYSLPVGRRINIDFTAGIGYLGGIYLKYVPSGDHYEWRSTHNLKWFGPVKAEISLVWLIGNGNYNRQKED